MTLATSKRPGGRSARVRRAVLDATLSLLAEGGFRALSMESVATAAGVNKTTVYRNWPTKTALILAAAEDRSEKLIAVRATGDVERDLIAFLASVAANITSPLGHALVIATVTESGDPEVEEARRTFWRHRFEAAGDLIRSAAGREIDDAAVDHAIEQLIGPLYLRAFVTGAPLDDEFIRKTARTALRLVG